MRPKRSACCRKSDEVSTSTVRPACSTITETRRRLSRGSSDLQVTHSQPIEGTPVDVPVPRKVSFMFVVLCTLFFVLCSLNVQLIRTNHLSTKYENITFPR